jgi:hypothetical protein
MTGQDVLILIALLALVLASLAVLYGAVRPGRGRRLSHRVGERTSVLTYHHSFRP